MRRLTGVEERKARRVTVIATLPPPTTGMTSVTAHVVGELRKRADVHIVNLSEGGASKRRTWKVVRSLRQLRASLAVALGRAGEGSIYAALNSGPAVALDAAMVLAARLRGRRVYLHHHSFRFVDRPSPLLRWVYQLGGPGVVDIALCEQMAAGLEEAYGRTNVRVVPNVVTGPAVAGPRAERGDGRIRLGHLSNLSIEKGVGRAVEAFEAARASGLDVELYLAGPFADDRAREVVGRAVARNEGRVVHVGPVYGAAKEAYYASLDLFLYPTAYAVEAQPLVLLEALAAGVPVVSADRGCVGGLAANARGESVVVSGLDSFSAAVIEWVGQLERVREQARRHAVMTAAEFAERARAALDSLVEEMAGLPRATVGAPATAASRPGP